MLCPRCQHLTKQPLDVHLSRCRQCPRCGRYVTQIKTHLGLCDGPKQSRHAKVKCPGCPVLYHPQGLYRHIQKEHPDEYQKTLKAKLKRAKRSQQQYSEKVFHIHSKDKNRNLGIRDYSGTRFYLFFFIYYLVFRK